jgi:hypothetical protein
VAAIERKTVFIPPQLVTGKSAARDDKLGVIINQAFLNPIFIPLGGPQAHEHSFEPGLLRSDAALCDNP